ncbi:hypothetical protein DFH06DRAFT_1044174 [Mycena polygramma]|nr:hypothetical protein DFH06DRAFT_1044174 [Mycena polygramma]
MHFTTIHGLSSSTFKPPLLDGSSLLPDVFIHHAQHSSTHPLFVYVNEDRLPKTITWSRAVDAFKVVAHMSRTQVVADSDSESVPVVAILASTDQITYTSMVAGVVLAGFAPFPLSTRNSPAAIAHLLQSKSCSHMFVSSDPSMHKLAAAAGVILGGDLKMIPMPTFQELFEPSHVPEILPRRVALDDAAVIMHSSGSTAFPKSITLTHRIFWESGLVPYHGDVDLCGEIISVHSLPMFHLLGLIQLTVAAYTGMGVAGFSPALPPVAPSADLAFEEAVATKSTLIICTPISLEAWARDSAKIPIMKKLITVMFGGGTLQPELGDELVKNGVNVSQLYGMTEASILTVFVPKSVPADGWDYFPISAHVDPALVPLEDNPGIYRVYFKKCATHTPAYFNATIDGVPALDTKDLIYRHPTNPRLWKIFGRADDQIMHSNGEKTNPVPIEKILHEDPAIKYAMMFGRGNFHAGVIIFPEEPFDPADMERVAKFRRTIWPSVEQANRVAPTHSRIFKEMILVADPSKPIDLTAKGTPRRPAVLEGYADEIRNLYKTVEETFQKHIEAPVNFDPSSSLDFVRKVVGEVMVETPGDDDDIFQYGCDSLQATWIRNSIIHGATTSQQIDTHAIPTNFVYSHPTLRLLAEMLTRLAAGEVVEPELRTGSMEAMVEKYTQGFLQHVATVGAPSAQAVLVTGSTGAFGCHILAHLLALPEISRVYALNRPSTDLRQRQYNAFLRNGIDVALLDSPKLKLLAGDLNADQFALSSEDFDALLNNVTSIIHNAWQVNFNLTLSSMEPLVAGTRKLIDFALASPHPSPPRLVFVSSAGVFRDFNVVKSALECPIADPRISVGLGYAESKWVAEKVLEIAGKTTALSPVIVRPGQLSAAANGAWNTSEWFPVLLRSSHHLGQLPDISGRVTWLPVHHAAKALVEMRGSEERYMHLTHPSPVPMADILSAQAKLLGIPLVPYSQWLESLETAASQESAASVNPGVRLIHFFRSYREVGPEEEPFFPAFLSNTVAVENSPSLQSLAPLTAQDVEGWTAYLRQEGLLP